ncbi:uncharacterized protein METZ01_LOCUS499630 [marine metagenome]|uniref:Uncharacterized protein n=1 Tax=marine metagenome TaxID=408172 RepID=A0A383DQJ7_9ZZZZ
MEYQVMKYWKSPPIMFQKVRQRPVIAESLKVNQFSVLSRAFHLSIIHIL